MSFDLSAILRPFTLRSVTKEQNGTTRIGGENVMLRKLSIAAAIASVLLLPAATSAETVHRKNVNVNRNVHVNKNVNRNVNVNRTVRGNYVFGRAYNGHYWYGQDRHRWRGRWYAYGVGPCWINV